MAVWNHSTYAIQTRKNPKMTRRALEYRQSLKPSHTRPTTETRIANDDDMTEPITGSECPVN